MTLKNELITNIDERYIVLEIRKNVHRPHAYAYVEDKFGKPNNRKGLLSTDGGKTWKEVWEKDDTV